VKDADYMLMVMSAKSTSVLSMISQRNVKYLGQCYETDKLMALN
jgi:hypothetical protein